MFSSPSPSFTPVLTCILHRLTVADGEPSMKNPFKNSRQGADQSATQDRDAITQKSENPKKDIRVLYEDPIIFGKVPEPQENEAPPEDENPWGGLLVKAVLIILALFLFRWAIGGLLGGHAPDLDYINNLIQQVVG